MQRANASLASEQAFVTKKLDEISIAEMNEFRGFVLRPAGTYGSDFKMSFSRASMRPMLANNNK